MILCIICLIRDLGIWEGEGLVEERWEEGNIHNLPPPPITTQGQLGLMERLPVGKEGRRRVCWMSSLGGNPMVAGEDEG